MSPNEMSFALLTPFTFFEILRRAKNNRKPVLGSVLDGFFVRILCSNVIVRMMNESLIMKLFGNDDDKK